jgi:hypothetical protein
MTKLDELKPARDKNIPHTSRLEKPEGWAVMLLFAQFKTHHW